MSSITIVSDAPNCGVTYDRHYDDRNSFITQATVERKRRLYSYAFSVLKTFFFVAGAVAKCFSASQVFLCLVELNGKV